MAVTPSKDQKRREREMRKDEKRRDREAAKLQQKAEKAAQEATSAPDLT
ncbi:MAG: hypothetical protein ACKVHO_04785 [Verrucomicrobiia bacterium]|jgi:hypothetical protein